MIFESAHSEYLVHIEFFREQLLFKSAEQQ